MNTRYSRTTVATSSWSVLWLACAALSVGVFGCGDPTSDELGAAEMAATCTDGEVLLAAGDWACAYQGDESYGHGTPSCPAQRPQFVWIPESWVYVCAGEGPLSESLRTTIGERYGTAHDAYTCDAIAERADALHRDYGVECESDTDCVVTCFAEDTPPASQPHWCMTYLLSDLAINASEDASSLLSALSKLDQQAYACGICQTRVAGESESVASCRSSVCVIEGSPIYR